MPHSVALATSPLQNNLQAVHSDVQHPSREVSRYLRDIMQPTIARATRSGLRSHSDTTSYFTPRLRTKFGERAFSFSGPAARNSLPADLRTAQTSPILRTN